MWLDHLQNGRYTGTPMVCKNGRPHLPTLTATTNLINDAWDAHVHSIGQKVYWYIFTHGLDSPWSTHNKST